MIGETLGKYQVVEHLGHGSMAEVYKAYQPRLDRYVAIKVLHSFLASEENFLARFQREAKAIATLRHPHIVQVYDFDYDEERDVYYMVMEFIDGPSLKVQMQELAARDGRIRSDEAIRIVTAVGEALDYAHQRGMVHRDVKPANIMSSRDGQTILTDFGIAKMVNLSGLTASGAMVGTPSYISPEQGMGKAGDKRSDIYSLGIVLYQLVTEKLPFDAETPMGVVIKRINEPPPSPRTLRPDLSEELERVIMQALARYPAQRYQTAAEFVADLRRVAAGQEIQAPPLEETEATPVLDQITSAQFTPPPAKPTPAPTSTPPPAPRRRRLWIPAILGIVALLLVGTAGVLTSKGRMDDLLNSLGILPTARMNSIRKNTSTPNRPATQMAATVAAVAGTLEAPTDTPTPIAPTPTLLLPQPRRT